MIGAREYNILVDSVTVSVSISASMSVYPKLSSPAPSELWSYKQEGNGYLNKISNNKESIIKNVIVKNLTPRDLRRYKGERHPPLD